MTSEPVRYSAPLVKVSGASVTLNHSRTAPGTCSVSTFATDACTAAAGSSGS